MAAISIFGANGRLGRRVVARALEQGHTVTAAVRRPDDFADARTSSRYSDRLHVQRADVADADSVRDAIRGSQAVISAIGPAGRHPRGLYSEGTTALIAGMEAEGVDRFVCVSSGAVVPDDRNIPFFYRGIIVPLFMRELYEDMRRMEKAVLASSLQWTLVRPGYLRESPPRGSFRVEENRNPAGGWRLSRDDLATFIVEQIEDDAWLYGKPTLAY